MSEERPQAVLPKQQKGICISWFWVRADGAALSVRRNGHKFNAKATVVDGIRFASQKEARRYQELRLWEKSGGIRNLALQPRFVLSVSNALYPDNDKGRSIELGTYVGDFVYEECDHANGHSGWKNVVEDVKGFKTPLYRWKKRHVEAQFGIQIREI